MKRQYAQSGPTGTRFDGTIAKKPALTVAQRTGPAVEKASAMLCLQLKDGEIPDHRCGYRRSGVPRSGAQIRAAVQAPREMTVPRGEVREHGGARCPAG